MLKEIGGFLELELEYKGQYHSNAIALNSCRNAIRYVIKAYKIKKLNVPYYTCPVVWQAIAKEHCEIIPYGIDKNFLPQKDFKQNDYVLYTNYFGILSSNVKLLAQEYNNLITDNAMAFFMPNYGIASTYSPRKFFGVPDGGFLISNKLCSKKFPKDKSFNRFSHLLKRIDKGANFAYKDFNKNDASLVNAPIKSMSPLTYKICGNIDYERAKQKRLENFHYLAESLSDLNKLNINITDEDVPMYYPFLFEDDGLRQSFLQNNIYIASCWRNLETICEKSSYEIYLQKYLFPLIIDQRYDKQDLNRIIKIIRGTNE